MSIEDRCCHDCNAAVGEIHDLGCDMERCPFCTHQLISCDCIYKLAGINVVPGTPGFDAQTYTGGPSEAVEAAHLRKLEEKGRIPYIPIPWICETCGVLWPDMFRADDWANVVPSALRKYVLCSDCYEKIKAGLLPPAQLVPNQFCVLCGSEPMPQRPADLAHFVPPLYHSNAHVNLQDGAMCQSCFDDLKRLLPNGWRQGRR